MGAAAHPRDRRGGFALAEVMIALVMIALIAALAMPGLVRPTGPGTLRAAAMNASALLRTARNAALGSGHAATVTANGGSIRSASVGAAVSMPPGATAGPPGAAVRFAPDGRASGGPLILGSAAGVFAIGADPETGAIDVSAR